MDTKSVEILDLAEKIRLAIREDWGMQRVRGERLLGYSEDNMQKQVKARYPKIGTGQIFKTIYGYSKYNKENPGSDKPKKFLLDKLKIILRFLYVDIRVDAGWPEVSKTLLEFKGGKYTHLIEQYIADDGFQKIQTILTEELLVKAGATPGQNSMTQLLQLVLKTNDEYKTMENKNERLKAENDQLKEAAQERERKANHLRSEIARMQGALESKGGDHIIVLNEIKKLQDLLDSLN